MRSLAFKIFVGFWTIHALIFIVVAFVPDPNRTARLRDIVKSEGRLAAALYEESEPGVCSRFLASIGETHSANVSLYNPALLPVCQSGQDIDDRAYRPIAAAASAGGVVTEVSGREVCAVTVTSRSGQPYRIAMAATTAEPLDPWQPRFAFGVVVSLVLVSGIVCLGLASYLAAPLRKMREATHRLREGDLSARVGVESRNDEIGDVVRDFDVMADRIESLVHGQQQLLSDISHELRSPLARLGVAVELARRTAPPGADSHLARIETEAGRMNELIGRLLQLSREHAESQVRLTDFDLGGIVRRVVEDAQYEAGRTGRRVELSGEEAVPAHGDPVLAASAVDNVVRNAIRYTPAGSSVGVILSLSSDTAEVAIRDHGPGVPPAELERIFQPFYRLDASRTRESGGIGLGLSIARRSVGVMNGAIRAANAPDGGLQVTISLPRALGADAPQ
jgi:signal transduction histidine kinase